MEKGIIALFSIAAMTLGAADVGRVIVRQQWPWSTKINVDFELSGVSPSSPADISLRCYNGSSEIPAATVEAALSGERYALTGGRIFRRVLVESALKNCRGARSVRRGRNK